MLLSENCLRPQAGQQEAFLATPADIAIYGGAAGGGKSYALLLEALRNVDIPGFGCVVFRRQGVEIKKQGGLWDESQKLFPALGGIPRETLTDWKFKTDGDDARISFSHLEQERDKYTWQGGQIPLILFDELTHFTKTQFFYMLSRNRSTCGIKPYIRATTNPEADSWVGEIIAWWIDQNTGTPIKERSGVIRYFVRRGEDLIWGDTPEDLVGGDVALSDVKSFTFIASTVYDNKILLEKDPGYLANLKALNAVDRGRLLDGNWKIRPSSGLYFKRQYFEIVAAAPASLNKVRQWDLAATPENGTNDPDWTVGLLASRDRGGLIYVENIVRLRGTPSQVENTIVNTASQDGKSVAISIPQDPGQAGKAQASYFAIKLAGYKITSDRETGDKITRASPASSQAEAGNIKLVRGDWNEAFITELVNFPNEAGHDDQVDTLSGAVNFLVKPQSTSFFSSQVRI